MVTAAQRHKANLDPIEDAHILLLEFQEDGSSTVHRAAVNNEDIVSNGNTFTATDIGVNLPNSGDQMPSVSLDMSNITREIGKSLNWARNRVGARLMLVDASIPNTAIIDTLNMMVIAESGGDSVRVSATLGPRAALNEPWPPRPTSKQFFPGVWWIK